SAIRTAMIAITTNSSISVKPRVRRIINTSRVPLRAVIADPACPAQAVVVERQRGVGRALVARHDRLAPPFALTQRSKRATERAQALAADRLIIIRSAPASIEHDQMSTEPDLADQVRRNARRRR